MGNKQFSSRLPDTGAHEYVGDDQIQYLVRIQRVIRKILAFRKRNQLYKERVEEIKNELDDKIHFENVSKKRLREQLGNNYHDLILRNYKVDRHFDILLELNTNFLFKSEFPIRILSKDNFIYHGFWDLHKNMTGAGMAYYITNHLSEEPKILKFYVPSTRLSSDFKKTVIGIYKNSKLCVSNCRIIYSAGHIYDGEVAVTEENDIYPSGKGILYINCDRVNLTNNPFENRILKIKGTFNNDLIISSTDYEVHFNDFFFVPSENWIITSKYYEGELFFKDGTYFKGKFKLQGDNNKIVRISGLNLYSNGNIYQGDYLEGKYNGKSIYFECEANRTKQIDQQYSFGLKSEYDENKSISSVSQHCQSYNFMSRNTHHSVCQSVQENSMFSNTLSKMKTELDQDSTIAHTSIDDNYKYVREIEIKMKFKPNFIPYEDVMDNLSWGRGNYFQVEFLNSKIHGKGMIYIENKMISAIWRFGKLISAKEKSKKPKKLHQKIFDYLSTKDLSKLISIKNSSFLQFFKSHKEVLLKIKLFELYLIDYENYSKESSSHYLNSFDYIYSSILFKKMHLGVVNLNSVLESIVNGYQVYIPLLPIKTNRGISNKRCHYYNVFNPDSTKCYYSSYLCELKHDAELYGVLHQNVLSTPDLVNLPFKGDNSYFVSYNQLTQISSSKNFEVLLKSKINQFIKSKICYAFSSLKTQRRTHEEEAGTYEQEILEEVKQLTHSRKYYLESLPYKIDFENTNLDDSQLIQPELKSIKGCFCINVLLINNSTIPTKFIALHNPVRTLAVFVCGRGFLLEKNSSSSALNGVNYEKLNNKSVREILHTLQLSDHCILKTEKNEGYTLIEINSQHSMQHQTGKLVELNYDSPRLAAVIILHNHCQRLIKLKELHHFGDGLIVKLIDQDALYGSGIQTIDLVSCLAFGKILIE